MFEPPPQHLIRLRTRPDTLYISQNRTVLATRRDGFINAEPDHGFFVHGTRLLSRYEYRLNGRPLFASGLSNVEQHTWLGYYVAPAPGARDNYGTQGPGGATAQQSIELRLSRFVSDGLHEDVDVTNFTQQPAHLTLELRLDADFADTAETKSKRLQRGKTRRAWREGGDEYSLTFSYRAEHAYSHQGNVGTARLERGVTVHFENATTPPAYGLGRIRFTFDLRPQATWHVCIDLLPVIDGQQLTSQYRCRSFRPDIGEHNRRRQIFLATASEVSSATAATLAPVVVGALEQGKRDLAALRLYDFDRGDREWTMAAGLPVYVALFGRDTLTTSWQAAMVSPDMMPGTLAELAERQGTRIDDWRDEQPGKMLHQAETGPLAMLNLHPLRRYYGSITTSGFYPVVVSELWHWTGDKALVQRFLEPAFRALRWLDEYADFDRDGFYEYQTRSEQGVRNQGWKDSDDAIVHEDGSQADVPIATCEEQAFVYLAKLHLSEVLWWLDEKEEARRLYREATELKKRFNDAFWMEDLGFFAMALDADKRPVRSIGSNPGHCLAAGIVDEPFVRKTADRLFQPDMFTGWGIRTLSILGLYPYAPLNLLLVDPQLPEWLPDISLRNLHVGEAAVDLRFFRTRSGGSDYEVLDERGALHIVRQPSPWSLTATFGERLQDALSSLVPH